MNQLTRYTWLTTFLLLLLGVFDAKAQFIYSNTTLSANNQLPTNSDIGLMPGVTFDLNGKSQTLSNYLASDSSTLAFNGGTLNLYVMGTNTVPVPVVVGDRHVTFFNGTTLITGSNAVLNYSGTGNSYLRIGGTYATASYTSSSGYMLIADNAQLRLTSDVVGLGNLTLGDGLGSSGTLELRNTGSATIVNAVSYIGGSGRGVIIMSGSTFFDASNAGFISMGRFTNGTGILQMSENSRAIMGGSSFRVGRFR